MDQQGTIAAVMARLDFLERRMTAQESLTGQATEVGVILAEMARLRTEREVRKPQG